MQGAAEAYMSRMDPFDRRAMTLSLGLHILLLGGLWFSTFYQSPELEFIAYEIELVSPPPAEQAEEEEFATEEVVIEQPEPEPVPPEPEPEEEEVAVEEPAPEPEPSEPPPEVDEEEVSGVTTEEPPEEEPAETGEDLNVRLEGLRRDYPEYYNNIIRQIQRCFRPPSGGGGFETTVVFTVGRDGLARDIDFSTRSGNIAFDLQAMGAVECAGQGNFGQLPQDYLYDAVRVNFAFRPPG